MSATRLMLALVASASLAACSHTKTTSIASTSTPMEAAHASWYGPGFHGNRTANGEIYNQNGLTAAHKTLPFNTLLYVENPHTGLSTTVRVNDRGPFIPGREIDLSRGAAAAIGLIPMGVAEVNYRIVPPETTSEDDSD